jgi:SAM-dependent methyltransferase
MPAVPAEPISGAFAASVDAAWGNPDDWVADGLHWTHLHAIHHRINRRVTGDPELSPLAWFFREVAAEQALPFQRVLILGCGMGGVERQVVGAGWAREVVAVDLSHRSLEQAEATAAAEGLAGIRFCQADMNALPLGTADFLPGAFDAVLGISGVHHCENLEGLYAATVQLLRPDGWLFLDEYIGPTRFQYSQAQVRAINRLLLLLPERLARNAHGALKRNLQPPTPEEVIAVDPSEAVRSADVLPVLDGYFRVVQQRGYGGAILHPLLAQIAQNFDAAAAPYLEALMAAEDELQRSGVIGDEFVALIARPLSA